MPDAGANPRCRLVERQRGASQPCFFSDGNCCGGLCRARVGDDAGANARAIRQRRTLGSCSGLGHNRVARHFRASLPEGRKTMARLDSRRRADVIVDP